MPKSAGSAPSTWELHTSQRDVGAGPDPRPEMVSVIIPTKNRPADLEGTLRTLLAQSAKPDEVLIIDQSASDETRQRALREYARAQQETICVTPLRYLHDPTIPGSAVARNIGIESSSGSIVVFLDDDVLLEVDFLQELLRVFRDHPTVQGASALITNYSKPPVLVRAFSAVFRRGPFHDERQPVYWNADRLRDRDPIQVSKFGAGGMGFRRNALENTRFDPTLRGVPGGEDVDFCCRLGKTCKLVLAPRARYVHNHSPTNRPKEHWLTRDVRSQHYLYKRNWSNGVWNRFCFFWLNLGYLLLATIVCLYKRSWEPWQAFREGVRAAERLALVNKNSK